MTRWPSGAEPRREAHVLELADHLALAGLDVEQIDARHAVGEGHVGDLLRRRREPRRQHQVAAAGQDAHVGAILIHDGEPFDALLLRPALVDEHHAAVEVAGLAGEPLIDRIRDDVRDPPPDVGRGEILRAGELLVGGDVPQPEFRFQPAVALPGDAAGDQRLGVDGAPVGEARQSVDVGDPLEIGLRIDRREQAGALQVGGDDLRDVARDLAIVRGAADEVRNRDRDRLDVALGDVDADHGAAPDAAAGRAPRRRRRRRASSAASARIDGARSERLALMKYLSCTLS